MPAIMLASLTRSAHIIKFGSTEVTLPAGKHLKVETSPAGEDLFDGVVPSGTQWVARVSIECVETTV